MKFSYFSPTKEHYKGENEPQRMEILVLIPETGVV
jgi:hypothetical protein